MNRYNAIKELMDKYPIGSEHRTRLNNWGIVNTLRIVDYAEEIVIDDLEWVAAVEYIDYCNDRSKGERETIPLDVLLNYYKRIK